MIRREKPKLSEAGGIVRLQQAMYSVGSLGWMIFVAVLFLLAEETNKPGFGPTFIMISLGPLAMGFIVAAWSWIFLGGLHHFFRWGTFCASFALLIALPVVMFMDDIAGASPGLILTVLFSAAGGGILFAWVTNSARVEEPPQQ